MGVATAACCPPCDWRQARSQKLLQNLTIAGAVQDEKLLACWPATDCWDSGGEGQQHVFDTSS